jgi:release factor glutamine methyltransferase
MNIHALLYEAQISLGAMLSPSEAKFETQILLQHALGVDRAWLITHENDALQPNAHELFDALLKRRLKGEPIAYILGTREFYGLKLKVTPDTLIPRPDTEVLVDAVLAKIPHNQPCRILDLGTGTGAIALAIAKHRPQTLVTAIDVSQTALDIANENAHSLNIPNVRFVLSDWFVNLKHEKFDVVVSNPPYIEQDDEHLQQGDLRFEPISALAAGQDGLDAIRKIISQAAQHLSPHGWLMLEHGYNQANSIADFLIQAGFSEIIHVQDLAGIERVTLGCYKQACYLAPSRA